MSKAQIIRKKALDLVRDQDWPNAIKEYRRLVELDQSNPNVHNELADLYLKTSQKAEAYDAFVRAIDEYNRVGLFNNAVAVCKKVLRVLPSRTDVLLKLAFIRSRQGLAKEAESYYLQFFDKTANGGFEPAEFLKLVSPVSEDMPDSTVVLERLSQCLLGYHLDDEAGNVLIKLYVLYERSRDADGMEKARAIIEKLGFTAKLDVARAGRSPAADRTVITEDNLWTKTHTEGERIEVQSASQTVPPGTPAAPVSSQPTGAAPGGPSERDLYLLRLARGTAEPRPPAATPPPAAIPETRANAATPAAEARAEHAGAEGAVATETRPADGAAPSAAPADHASARPASGDGMQISALFDDEGGTARGETDHRSHYDLGMAYLEMDLLSEAIREYQVAARSPQYQVKCLEMIGLCFVKQNQPQLAIRQLTKGLSLIGTDSEESLGIKYNLGLAYEMVGDLANARTFFEDVYVVDVTFRDVSEKVRRLTEPS